MRITLPADVPVTFYPSQLDDRRENRPLKLEYVSKIPHGADGEITVFSDGHNIELHHSSQAKVIFNLNEVLAMVVKATFDRLALEPDY